MAGACLDYLDAHSAMEITLRRRLAVVNWLAQRIQCTDRVLEWGCRHALDSCLYRLRFGPEIELYGCDLVEADVYQPFFEFAGLNYSPLRHPYRLDYADAFFDVVTSNGVWEHVPEEESSLLEIFRVLKEGGLFLVACLPNRFSYTEALQRKLGHTSHDRLYTVASARRLLVAAGFEMLTWEYRFLVPTMLNGFPPWAKSAYQKVQRLTWMVNGVLENLWPINRVASNLMIVARKPKGGGPSDPAHRATPDGEQGSS
jgi:SAM-dependent methyltransferase